MNEDQKKGWEIEQQVKSQEEKNNDQHRIFATILLENGDYHWEHQMLKGWGEEDSLLWEEEFLPSSMRVQKKVLKREFWKEMGKIKAKNRKEYETTVCRYCKHSHWHANGDVERGYYMYFSCQRFGKIEIPVSYCSDIKE